MKYTVIFVIAVIALIILSLLLTRPLHTILAKYHLLPEPEKFTELYFENHQNLPSRVEAGEKYTFAFSVHSEEQVPMTYPYRIYIQTDKKRIPVQTGTFSLVQDQKKTFQEKFLAPSYNKSAEVVVELVNKNQSIDFWINE